MYSTKPMAAAILLPYLCLIHSLLVVASVTKLDRIRCIEREGRALLEFKKNLVDDYGRLSSWTSHHDKATDCCRWKHVYCSNFTHHVIRLDLQGQGVTGNLTSSLLVLEHLVHLDLSGNFFEGMAIPGFIGSLYKLRYLNFSSSQFSGEVPYQLKNLSSLQHLDLSQNYDLSSKDPMAWLSSLSSLRHLTLSNTNLSQAAGWARAISNLPSLRYLDLSNSHLPDEAPSLLVHTNLSKSLAYVDLSGNSLSGIAIYPWLFNFSSSLVEVLLSFNNIEGPLPEAFGKLVSVSHLDLSNNQLHGPIPDFIGNLSHLFHLDLSQNQLDNGIPNSFQHLCRLQTLDISLNSLTQDLPVLFKSLSGCPEKSLVSLLLDFNSLTGSLPDFTIFSSLKELSLSLNKLNGTFPPTFQQISPLVELELLSNRLTGSLPHLSVFPSLTDLSLGNNSLNGTISERHLSNLTSLTNLDLSSNSLVLDISANWTPPFQLDTLTLTHCRLGPQFPRWLQNWGSVSHLDISSTGISDSIPAWFWNVSVRASRLTLSDNKIHGTLPDSPVQFYLAPTIDLSNNSIEGAIPSVFRTTASLSISKNKLSGSFPTFLCEVGDGVSYASIDLSDNFLSGELPDCWKKYNNLVFLLLSNNNFSGEIPASLGFLQQLRTLQLSNNGFQGKLPSSLRRCQNLRHVDIANNFLSGEVPLWIGNGLLQLVILSLRNNLFTGIIPPQLCKLSSLQILDLSSNTLSGTIPHCLSNLSAMVVLSPYRPIQPAICAGPCIKYNEDIEFSSLLWKGTETEYKDNLGLVTLIDLSSNKLDGEIPNDLSNLTGLISLNLSRNQLEGQLNSRLGWLKSLEILDLSRNRLYGEIPTSFSNLSSLSKLDLSYNNLSGRIPTGTQLQSFDAISYAGNNPGLCGDPLPHLCPGDDRPTKDSPGQEREQNDGPHEDEEDSFLSVGVYVSVSLGFATGFWGICGSLIFNRSMRYAYFRFLDHIYDKLYILVKFQGRC